MFHVIICLMVLLAVSSSEGTGCTPGMTNLDLSRITEGTWIPQKFFLEEGRGNGAGEALLSFEIDLLQENIDVPPEVTDDMTVMAAEIKFDYPLPHITAPLLGLGAISKSDGIIYAFGALFQYEDGRQSEILVEPLSDVQFIVVGTDYDSWLLVSFCDRYTNPRESAAMVFSRGQNIDEATMTSIKDQYPSLFSKLPEEFPNENTVESRAEDRPSFLNTFFKGIINGVN